MQFNRTHGADGSVLPRLRESTAAHHRAIEDRLNLGGEIALAHYVAVLQGFDAFLQSWEGMVTSALPARLRTWAAQGRSRQHLQRDLRALGARPLPPADIRLPLHSSAAAMGSLYVLEGSALGAQVIAPRLAQQHGLGPDNGAAWFTVDAESAAQRWRDFRFLLEQQVVSPGARQQACSGAVATFQALHEVFDSLLPARDVRAAA